MVVVQAPLPIKRDKTKIVHNLNVRMPNLVIGYTTDPVNELLSVNYQKAAYRIEKLRAEQPGVYYPLLNKVFTGIWDLGNAAEQYHRDKHLKNKR